MQIIIYVVIVHSLATLENFHVWCAFFYYYLTIGFWLVLKYLLRLSMTSYA